MAAGKVKVSGTGKTDFLVRHFSVRESLSTLFSCELDLLTLKRPSKLGDFVGQPWTLTIDLPKDKKRYFNAHVANVVSTGALGRFASYHATLRPALWFLSLTSNCRIFPNMSAPEIVRELTDKAGVALDASGLEGNYPPHRYLVQYRETDLNFISRLMEYEGIYYYFQHEDGKHTMVLADGAGAHKPFPDYGEVRYHFSDRAIDTDHVDQWTYSASVQTKKYALNDYDFKKPNAEILVKLEGEPAGESDPTELEQYDFPGAFFDAGRGEDLIAVRQQEALANTEVARGAGNVRGISVGSTFKLKDHPHEGQNAEYLVTHGHYDCSSGDYEGSGDDGGDDFFRCQFAAIKAATQFRPARLTPRPVINGLQSAKVIGPKGKEIWTDAEGRIRIKFHWQRPEEDAAREEASAIWVRVSHLMAGKSWGSLHIPRIGHEVVVSFLEGDPDRPIVTGCVYNDANKPPFNPSGGGMVMGIKSDSTPGGGGYNEISLDDTKGDEKITIHGQFDMNTTIEHDQTLTVHNNRTSMIDVDDSETVGKDQTQTVGANQSNSIGANQDTTVGASHTLAVLVNSAETIGAAKELTVGGAYQVSVGAAMNETVGGMKAEEVGAAKSVSVGGNSGETVGGSKTVSVSKDLKASATQAVAISASKKMTLSAGEDLAISGGKKGVLDIADEFTIKVGSAKITLKKSGDIVIKGAKIKIDGSSDVVVKGSKIAKN